MKVWSRFVDALAVALLVGACAAPPQPETARAQPDDISLPPARSFGPGQTRPPQRSNAEMARDFLDLSFALENGRPITVLSRFEEPVTVRLTGAVPGTAGAELSRLLGRLRNEARIDIAQVPAGMTASITVEFLQRSTMQRYVPRAACFVVPRASSWKEYLRAGRSDLDWSTVTRRDRAAIFIPNDTTPQEIRDCLHEELAQALGPLNDLYRLPDSVFNDDNVTPVLTGFDMLMLRVHYAPELASGMLPGAVALQVPGILNRINPSGRGSGALQPDTTPRTYSAAIDIALGPGAAPSRRRSAALEAVRIAEERGWHDSRAGFAWMAVGRLTLGDEPALARHAFAEAAAIFHNNPRLDLYAAQADSHLCAFSLADGDAEAVIRLSAPAIDAAREGQDAALLANLMMVRAEALELAGRSAEARQVRLDSLGWARYGFGSDAEVRRRLLAVAALSPLHKTGTK